MNKGQTKIISEVIAELKRENATRVKVYPRWIEEGKITREEAEHRYLCIATAIKTLEIMQAQRVGIQSNMFDIHHPFTPLKKEDENTEA